jgi:hypothetical protein
MEPVVGPIDHQGGKVMSQRVKDREERRRTPKCSEILRAAILENRESLYALADRAELPRSVVARFVARERGLTLDSVDRLAEALGLRLIGGAPKRH